MNHAHIKIATGLLFLIMAPYVALIIMCFVTGDETGLDPRNWHAVWRLALIMYELPVCAMLAAVIFSALEGEQ